MVPPMPRPLTWLALALGLSCGALPAQAQVWISIEAADGTVSTAGVALPPPAK